jgi:C1A family cysteine protease
MIERKLGWRKQKPDARDFQIHHLRAVRPLATAIPATANLRRWCSYIEDQGQLGSCTANAWAGILQFDENKYPVAGRKYADLSRLFIYYNERVLDNTVNQDSGAELRDGAKVLNQYGVCVETEWPYNVSQFTVKPTAKCYTDALPNVIHSYYALDGTTPAATLTNLKTAIASGQPFVFGFNVYDSFMSDQVANTGVMPMPNVKTEQLQGGHAVMGVGYNDAEQRFLIRNSWGTSWGLPSPTYRGYFTMPYAFISDPNMASDFWTVVKDV